MQTLYEKILSKPKSYRRKLSYVITAIVGIVIFSAWLIITNFTMKKAVNFNDAKENFEEVFSEEKENIPSFSEEQKNFEQTLNELNNDNQEN